MREQRCRWYYERSQGRDPGPLPEVESLTIEELSAELECECRWCGSADDEDPREAMVRLADLG